MKYDIHPHVISPDMAKYPLNPLGGRRSAWSSARSLTGAQLIAAMDEAGIDKAAVVQSSTTYGHDNSYVVDTVAQFPDRLTGVCSVDLLADDAVEKLQFWHERGCTGLRLFTTGSTMPTQSTWLNDPKTFPAWEYASEIGMPICIQALVVGVPMVRFLLERFPKVPILLDHFMQVDLTEGAPYAAVDPMFSLAEYPQVYLKLTPISVAAVKTGKATAESFFGKAIEKFGANRIAWGSNYPASEGSLPTLLGDAEKALTFLGDEDRSWIFGKTAAELYPSLA
jgi:L-fuconolactonase